MDTLSHMLLKALRDGSLQGIKLAPTAPTLTHLFFVDDSLILAKASPQQLYQIMQILNIFSQASSQRINLHKPGIICRNALDIVTKQSMAAILQMQIWSNSSFYLGLPSVWGRSKVAALPWVKERVQKNIEGWKEALLNQAGKKKLSSKQAFKQCPRMQWQ
ncbi:uncharacterized protein LOC130713138 [Lotus japonicus]|uniref:uncharacterized protein LOC130713138 n=1 Tax=Lotus japonicus TaxID=34305 RepID=UPI002589975E|nr:uncharacterized protein LOC130713138 [Lotus japonicus]